MDNLMGPTVILPYTNGRTTQKDIDSITNNLHSKDSNIRLLAFQSHVTPIILAEKFPLNTITVTLNIDQPTSIFEYIPGPKYFAPLETKSRLVKKLVDAGIPMPHTETFSPDMHLDEEKFGPYATIKTSLPNTSRAVGIKVFKTKEFENLRSKLLKLYKKDIEAGYQPLVQQYIYSGSKPNNTTVSAFLGAPIVCFQTTAPNEFSPQSISGLAGGEATSNSQDNRSRTLTYDEEMVELAKTVCKAIPKASVLSVDMVRCSETKKLYCIEANLGNLCVLSAPICTGLRRDLGPAALHKQFGSYETIAKRMIETLDQISIS